jgi:hypothetical protein
MSRPRLDLGCRATKNRSKEQSPVLQLALPQQVKRILEFQVPKRLLLNSSVPTTALFPDPDKTTDTIFFVQFLKKHIVSKARSASVFR